MMYDSLASLCPGSCFFKVRASVRSWLSSKWLLTNRGWLAIFLNVISIPTPDSLDPTVFFFPEAIWNKRRLTKPFNISLRLLPLLPFSCILLRVRSTWSGWVVDIGTVSTVDVLVGRSVRTSAFSLLRKKGFMMRFACRILSFSYEDRSLSSLDFYKVKQLMSWGWTYLKKLSWDAIYWCYIFSNKNIAKKIGGKRRRNIYYSQTRIKCWRPISSRPGLQGHKIFADAIIKILISTKSIIDKNCYDQLFINKVVQIFPFQFDESVTKFYVVKVLSIVMEIFIGCGQIS